MADRGQERNVGGTERDEPTIVDQCTTACARLFRKIPFRSERTLDGEKSG